MKLKLLVLKGVEEFQADILGPTTRLLFDETGPNWVVWNDHNDTDGLYTGIEMFDNEVEAKKYYSELVIQNQEMADEETAEDDDLPGKGE